MSEEQKNMEDEIDLIELIKAIWAGRKFIAKVTVVFIIIGLVIALTSPVEYQASSKLLPESQEGSMGNLGGLGGLAGFAGLDLGGISGGANTLSPQLYPQIVTSLPFILELANDTLYFENEDIRTNSISYFQANNTPSVIGYVLRYTIGLPGMIKSMLSKDQLLEEDDNDLGFSRFSKKEWGLIERFKERVSVSLDDATGIVYISCEMPDPVAAAQLTKKVEMMITDAVIKYKTDKAKTNLEFVEKTRNDVKKEFEAVQLELALATDRNRNVNSSIGQIELTRIENEYNVTFEVYKGLSSQVEQARITLKEETPVFTILEPVRIPEDKSKPKRGMMMIFSTIMGVLFGMVLVLLINQYKKLFKS